MSQSVEYDDETRECQGKRGLRTGEKTRESRWLDVGDDDDNDGSR